MPVNNLTRVLRRVLLLLLLAVAVDGGAMYLGPGTALNVSLGAGSTRPSPPGDPIHGLQKGPRIFGNSAGGKGGGVLFSGDHARIDPALRTIAMGNNATFDLDISTPLRSIDALGGGFLQLASRRNRTDTLTILVKLTGHLGVPSGGVRVQVRGHGYLIKGACLGWLGSENNKQARWAKELRPPRSCAPAYACMQPARP